MVVVITHRQTHTWIQDSGACPWFKQRWLLKLSHECMWIIIKTTATASLLPTNNHCSRSCKHTWSLAPASKSPQQLYVILQTAQSNHIKLPWGRIQSERQRRPEGFWIFSCFHLNHFPLLESSEEPGGVYIWKMTCITVGRNQILPADRMGGLRWTFQIWNEMLLESKAYR